MDGVNTDYIDFELNQAQELIKIGLTQDLADYELRVIIIALSKTLRELRCNVKKQAMKG